LGDAFEVLEVGVDVGSELDEAFVGVLETYVKGAEEARGSRHS